MEFNADATISDEKIIKYRPLVRSIVRRFKNSGEPAFEIYLVYKLF